MQCKILHVHYTKAFASIILNQLLICDFNLNFFINKVILKVSINMFISDTGVTTMLNFFTTSNGFRSTLPVVSNLTAMNVWDGVCMCFIYASLLEFVCVNYVGRKRPLHNVVYRPGENPVTQVNITPSILTFKSIRTAFRLCNYMGVFDVVFLW